MGKYNTVIELRNAPELLKQLNSLNQQAEKAIDATVKDFKRRAPAWVSKEVSAVYGIKKADVTPTKKNPKAAGNVSVKGDTIATAALVYNGRVLTPTRFGMTPKAPKEAYTLKVQVKKGQRKTIGKVRRLTKKQRKNIGRNFQRQGSKSSNKSPIMLMHAGGGTYIPFQRRSKRRDDVHAIKTTSVPQMVDNELARKGIDTAIEENLSKRMEHHMGRYMGK